MKRDNLLTQAKVEELKKKLERLKKSQPGAAAEVARLAELGDFSENAEYQLAKSRLRGINQGIINLDQQINQAIIIETPMNNDTVVIGSTVTVAIDGKERTYQILGSVEAAPGNGIISHQSPLGTLLMDKKVNDEVTLKVGAKENVYKIISIK